MSPRLNKITSRPLQLTSLFCASLALMSCASVPLMSLPKLAKLDPETLEIEKVELAVRLDETIGIKKDTAQLFIKIENEQTKKSLTHRLVLNAREVELTPFLQKKEKAGYTVHRFKLSPEQAEAAESFRKNAHDMREEDGKNLHSSLTARVTFCRFKDGPSFDRASMTFYVRTNPGKDFYTLFKEQNMDFSAEVKARMKTDPVYCE